MSNAVNFGCDNYLYCRPATQKPDEDKRKYRKERSEEGLVTCSSYVHSDKRGLIMCSHYLTGNHTWYNGVRMATHTKNHNPH